MSSDILSILAAAVGGILPALAWLWFWLREDSKHPEPRRLIALAFLGGICAVAVAVPLEQIIGAFIQNQTLKYDVWSAIEESLKLLAVLALIFWRKDYDEPVDAVIYMICVALGFSAVENTLFLWNSSLSGTNLGQEFITGNLRFVGATLLHVLSSATIGVSLALGFYKPHSVKILYGLSGVILAILLHSTFNFLILNTPQAYLLRTFVFVWVGVVVLLAAIEFVKRIHPRLIRR